MRPCHRVRQAVIAAVVWPVVAAALASAQDMEPRAYSPSPVGANFLVTSYSWSTGAVVFDPTLPITDVHADVQGLVVAIGHSFNLLGNLGLFTAAIPYALADVTGKIQEEQAETHRSGLADARFKLSVNLRGNPAMSAREFVSSRRRTIVGTSLTFTAPASQYYPTKLINLGTNRWSFKPEVGVSVPKGRWDLDGYVGAWFYTSNADFYPSRILSDPGSRAGDPGARQLHPPAPLLGGRRRHVVQRRERTCQRGRSLHDLEQCAARSHGVVSRRQTVLREGGVRLGPGCTDRNRFQDSRRRLAGVVAEPEMVGTMSRAGTAISSRAAILITSVVQAWPIASLSRRPGARGAARRTPEFPAAAGSTRRGPARGRTRRR